MTYEAILFDMDGVLVTGYETVPDVYRRTTSQLLRAFGHPTADEWSMSLQNPAGADEFREACSEWDLPPEAAWGYRERVSTELATERIDAGERTAFPDTTVLASLAEDYAIGVVSNNRHDTVDYCVDTFDWGDVVDAYRGRFPTLVDYDRMKPNPRYLSWILDRLDASEVLFIGDRASDVRTAENAGADAALLTREGNDAPVAIAPTYHLTTLAELPELHAQGW